LIGGTEPNEGSRQILLKGAVNALLIERSGKTGKISADIPECVCNVNHELR